MPKQYAKQTRIVIATIDATLDVIYVCSYYFLLGVYIGSQETALPSDILTYTGQFLPVLKSVSLSRSVEAAARKTRVVGVPQPLPAPTPAKQQRAVVTNSDHSNIIGGATAAGTTGAKTTKTAATATITKHRRVPLCTVLTYSVSTLAFVLIQFFSRCGDRFPLANDAMRVDKCLGAADGDGPSLPP